MIKVIKIDTSLNDEWVGTATELLRIIGGREQSKRELNRTNSMEYIRKKVRLSEAKRSTANNEELLIQAIKKQELESELQ